ncbi:MAG: Maf family protein [Abditibacteriaceae bacterium]
MRNPVRHEKYFSCLTGLNSKSTFRAWPIRLHQFTQKLVLASASPRRSQLLETLGVPCVISPLQQSEPQPEGTDHATPQQFVERLAQHKATYCPLPDLPKPLIVLAADTVVWHKGKILNKPRDEDDAVEMLRSLRDDWHQVFTGICLKVLLADSSVTELVEHESTKVQFADVSDHWITQYVATGEPLDKAGAYAAQGRGAALVQRIEGDFWNVVGLPLARLARMLSDIGAPLESWWER